MAKKWWEDIPVCGNCGSPANKCICWDESPTMEKIVSWRIKFGFLISDYLEFKEED